MSLDEYSPTIRKRGRQIDKVYEYWEKASYAFGQAGITLDSGPATRWLKKLRDYLNKEFPEKGRGKKLKMKVWVETCKENGMFSYHVFSSKENVVQYWKDLCFAENDGDIRDKGDAVFVSKPEWLVGRAAWQVEVDEYYTRKGGQNEG